MADPPTPRSSNLVLVLGAALGIGLAAYGIARPGRARLAEPPSDAAAVVNGVPILRADHERAALAIGSDRRGGAALPEDRQRALERLIDEELLLRRALELGLERRDPRARAALVSAMVSSIVASAEQSEPDDRRLREHFQENSGYFREPDRIRLEQLFFAPKAGESDADHTARARAVRARWSSGETLAGLRALADPEPSPLPGELLPAHKLADLLGPTAARAASELSPGEISEPVRSGAGYHLLRLVERRASTPPRFELVRETVRSDHQRRAGERALGSALEQLRANAEIQVTP
jgi:hypothetical protein